MKYIPPRLKEKPKPTAFRLYQLDRAAIKKICKSYKPKVSDSEGVRRAIRFLHNSLYPEKKLVEHTGK